MSVLSMLLWLCRRSRSRRDSDDPRTRRLVRPSLELLEGRLAPGNLLFADGMGLVNLLSPSGSTSAGSPADPLANPFGATSSSPSSGAGLGLSALPPITTTNSAPAGGSAARGAGSSSAPTSGAGSSSPFSAPAGAPPSGLSGNNTAPSAPTAGGSFGNSSMSGSSSPPGGASGGGSSSMQGSGGGSLGSGGGSLGSGGGSLGSGGGSSTSTGYVMITGFENSQGQPLPILHVNLTNDPKPIVVGVGAPGETLSFQIDGAAVGSTTVGSSGQWTFAVTTALTNGDHTVQVTSGGAGFTSSTMSTNLSVDLVPPTVTLTAPAFADYQPPLLQVQAAANDNYGIDSTVHIDVDLKHDGSFSDPGDKDFGVAQPGLLPNGTAFFNLMTALKAGTYSLRARVDDVAGNEGVSAISTMVVNPYMGYVGSQALLDLAVGAPYGTDVPIPGNPGDTPLPVPPGSTNPSMPGMPTLNYPGVTLPTPGSGGVGASGFPFLQFDKQGRVLVDVHSTMPTNLGGLQSLLTAHYGFTAVAAYPSQVMVQGWLPINQILNLPNAADFGSVDPVYKPFTRTGSVESEGDAVIKAPTFRASQNVDGTGEKVGVISDSVNEFGGGLAQSQTSGDLGAVQVIADGPGGGGTDEGRAMLEIVHDVAPGAALAFDAAGNSPQSFAGAINALAGAGSNVINDDIGFFNEPFFNNGVIGQAAETVVNQGVFYDSAAGNNGNHGYSAAWSPITKTVGGVNGTFQNIQGGSALQTFTLGAGATVTLTFEWSSPFLEGGAPGAFMVPNNLQVLVTNAAGTTLDATFNSQGTSVNEAVQIVQFTNNGSFGSNNFAFAFNLMSGPAPGLIAWVSQDDGNAAADPMALLEGGPTDYGHPTAPGVVGAAAAFWGTPTTAETFSAQGGFPLLFGDAGAPLAQAIVTGPTVTAPDGVHTTFFGQGDGMGGFEFFGTSAATPHVAGAAALLLQDAQGGATPAQITQYLQQNAITMPNPIVTGTGLIQLVGSFTGGGGGGFGGSPGPQAPQFPDDRFEPNDTSDAATQAGRLVAGTTEIANLSVNYHLNGAPDYDWFRWTMGQAGTVTATETTTTAGAPTGNLELHLFTLQGNTLVDLGDSTVPGAAHAVSAVLAAGAQVLVEVKGHETVYGIMDQGKYTLDVLVQ